MLAFLYSLFLFVATVMLAYIMCFAIIIALAYLVMPTSTHYMVKATWMATKADWARLLHNGWDSIRSGWQRVSSYRPWRARNRATKIKVVPATT